MFFKKSIPFYILIALTLHLIAVFLSDGFYNDDEHFQILEPVSHLMGFNDMLTSYTEDPSWLYWEWKEHNRIRPWLQPYIYFYFINFLLFLGIKSPFGWLLYIKLISSLIGFISLIYLFFSVKKYFIKKDNNFFLSLYFCFWFYPFIHARTSSENLSFSLFLISFCFLLSIFENKYEKINYLKTFFFGFLLGLSLVIRFNLIFTILPCLLWAIIFRFNIQKLLTVSLGLLIALFIGLYIDSIYWNEFSFTYWRMFDVNIINEKAASFGRNPWWYYIWQTLIELAPVVSLFFIIGLILYCFQYPLSIFSFLSFFTILIISFFPHKETRYIFPVYIFAPFFIGYLLEKVPNNFFSKLLKTLILFSNFIFLIAVIFFPANAKVDTYKFLSNNFTKGEKVYFINNNPYFVNGIELKFYTNFLPKIDKIDSLNKISREHNSWIITNIYKEYQELLTVDNCYKKYSTYPTNIININPNWRRLKINWYIFYCKP